MLRYEQLRVRFQCPGCAAPLCSNVLGIRFGMAVLLLGVLAYTVKTGVWEAVAVVIVLYWPLRRLLTSVWPEEKGRDQAG